MKVKTARILCPFVEDGAVIDESAIIVYTIKDGSYIFLAFICCAGNHGWVPETAVEAINTNPKFYDRAVSRIKSASSEGGLR